MPGCVTPWKAWKKEAPSATGTSSLVWCHINSPCHDNFCIEAMGVLIEAVRILLEAV